MANNLRFWWSILWFFVFFVAWVACIWENLHFWVDLNECERLFLLAHSTFYSTPFWDVSRCLFMSQMSKNQNNYARVTLGWRIWERRTTRNTIITSSSPLRLGSSSSSSSIRRSWQPLQFIVSHRSEKFVSSCITESEKVKICWRNHPNRSENCAKAYPKR